MAVGRVQASGRVAIAGRQSGIVPFFDLNPNDESTLTLDAASPPGILEARSNGRTLNSTFAPFKLDRTTRLNNRQCVALTPTANPELVSRSGPVLGNQDHAIIALVQGREIPAALRSFGMFGRFIGAPDAASGQVNSLIGVGANTWWAGGANIGAPTSAYSAQPTIIGKSHVAGTTRLTVDGAVTGTLAVTYGVVPGFGIGFWNTTADSPNVNLFREMWFDRSLSLIETNQIVRDWITQYGLALTTGQVATLGDSLTAGTGSSTVPGDASTAYPAKLVTELAARGKTTTSINGGNPGFRTDQISAVAQQIVDFPYSARRSHSLFVLMAGTNDISQGIPAVTILTNLQNICTARKALGYKVFLNTIPPLQTGTTDSPTRGTVNTWIRTQAVPLGFATAFTDLDLTTYGDLASPSLHSDPTHYNDGGYLALARMVADTVQSFCV